jgi:hypothetical protein
VPAGETSSALLPGGFGHHVSRHYDRGVGCPLGWDRRRRVTPVSLFKLACDRFTRLAASQETWPEAEPLGRRLPLARAVVERRQASAPASGGRRKPLSPWRDPRAACVRDMKHCVCRRSASFSFFRVVRNENRRSSSTAPAKPGRKVVRRRPLALHRRGNFGTVRADLRRTPQHCMRGAFLAAFLAGRL